MVEIYDVFVSNIPSFAKEIFYFCTHKDHTMYLALNLKYLRHKNNLSQQQLADALQAGRSTLAEYERGKTEPNIETLMRIADYFKVTLDELLRKNLSHEAYEIIKNQQLKVLAISVDRHKKGNIELVETKAEAGYLESAQDPEYIRELPKIYFPNMPEGTYRGFEIQGESMLPMEPGSIVICRYVENLRQIRNQRTYIVVTRREGLVYKRVLLRPDTHTLILQSDNPLYLPYEVAWEDIQEIWEYHAHLAFSDTKKANENALDEKLTDIQKKVNHLYQQFPGKPKG
jgi:transcriptional regulator with XRE-family HTH domain